ncbi:putative cation efflux protein [Helianthus annuus]|nr:putative cation efflux protein [Helianthus annuus]
MDTKTPLLSSEEESKHVRRHRRTSVTTLRGDFLSKLPEKVRCGLDPEAPLQVDLSKTTGLIEGNWEKEYYEKQFAALKSFEEVDSLRSNSATDNEEEELIEEAQHERAINISNWANVFLLALKIYATVQSGSLAIAASTLDSLLDLMAGGILWFTHLSMKSINIYKYPIGKLRVQPVGGRNYGHSRISSTDTGSGAVN